MKIYLAKDSKIKLNLSKAAKFLNAKCNFVEFEEMPISFQVTDELISFPGTHKKYLKHIKTKLQDDDYIILATERQYDDNFFYYEESGLIIISFFGWKYLTSLPKESGLVYFICGILLDGIVPGKAVDHTKRLGCINDFLYDKTRVHDGMRKGSLCPACKNYIKANGLTEIQLKLYNDSTLLLKELAIASKDGRSVVGDKKNKQVPQEDLPTKRNKNSKHNWGNEAVSVFISYSHKDERDRLKLEDHLKILQRLGIIDAWSDRKITAGAEWKNAIDENLNSSRIILMLISSSFLASDYCYDIEMKTALKRHDKKEVVAIPIILRECLWQMSPFAKLQALPVDGKPIQKFTRRDDAYANIARAICRIIKGE